MQIFLVSFNGGNCAGALCGTPGRRARLIPGICGLLVLAWMAALFATTAGGEETAEKAAAAPSDGPLAAMEQQIRVPSFKGVTPGQTTLDQAKEAIEAPFTEQKDEGQTTLTFNLEPFDKVEVTGKDQLVESIVIFLREPTAVEDLEKEIGVDQLRPAPISDTGGQVLGQVYPERGILFGFAEPDKPQQVGQIILQAIEAEPFIVRAATDREHHYSADLADLQYARKLDPQNAYVRWLLAKTYLAAGDCSAALENAEEAIRLDKTLAIYRVTKARILAKQGELQRARQLTEAIVADRRVSNLQRAQAVCLLGDLLAQGPEPNYKEAIQHHLAAIKMAAPLASDSTADLRRSAKRTLLDAHLGVAYDVAAGRWRRKEEVVPKWLTHAEAIAQDLIRREDDDPQLALLVHCRALQAHARMRSQRDPSALADAVVRDGQRLLASRKDRLYRGSLQRQLGEALLDAATIQARRARFNAAMQLAQQALKQLKQGRAAAAETTIHEDYVLGRLYYFIGSLHAVKNGDHEQALSWYERARPLLQRVADVAFDPAEDGQRLVTMGVSYWELGRHQEALELTKQGTHLIQKAVEQQRADQRALIVPYGNLAGMYHQLGKEEDARHFAETAARLRVSSDQTQQR